MEQRTDALDSAPINSTEWWTRVNFDVQLGFKITPEEIEDLPLATVDVDGNPAIPEMDGDRVVTRRITMSYPPHRAATLVVRPPRDGDPELTRQAAATLHAAFMKAVKQARREGSTEFFVNLGTKARKKTLIPNSLPTKGVLAGPPAPARLTS